jgi:hypothetical protein
VPKCPHHCGRKPLGCDKSIKSQIQGIRNNQLSHYPLAGWKGHCFLLWYFWGMSNTNSIRDWERECVLSEGEENQISLIEKALTSDFASLPVSHEFFLSCILIFKKKNP